MLITIIMTLPFSRRATALALLCALITQFSPVQFLVPTAYGASLTSMSATLGSTVAGGATGSATFNFTTVSPIPIGGKILIMLPAGFTADAIADAKPNITTFTIDSVDKKADVAAAVVSTGPNAIALTTQTEPLSGAVSIVFDNTVIDGNPVTPNTYNFPIETKDAGDATIDNGLAGVTITGGNAAPVANSVSITGLPQVGSTLTGVYTYADAESDPQGTSTFRWLSSSTSGGAYTPINAATNQTYTPVSGDIGKFLKFEVTPIAASGTTTGAITLSAPTAAVASGGGVGGAPSAVVSYGAGDDALRQGSKRDVIRINLAESSASVTALTVTITNVSGFTATDLLAITGTNTATSGIRLYADNKTTGAFGSFDTADTLLTCTVTNGLSTLTTTAGSIGTLGFACSGGATLIPANDTGNNAGPDFFVVAEAAASASPNHQLKIEILDTNDLTITGGVHPIATPPAAAGSNKLNILAATGGSDKPLISEINFTPGSQFVELYNPTNQAIDLLPTLTTTGTNKNSSGGPASAIQDDLRLYIGSATASSVTLRNTTGSETPDSIDDISPHGYFLIGASGSTPPSGKTFDATVTSLTGLTVSGGYVYISTSGVSQTGVLDKVGWGTATIFEGAVFGIAITTGQSIERKSGPAHFTGEGNGYDTDNNSNDLQIRSTPGAKMRTDPAEGGAAAEANCSGTNCHIDFNSPSGYTFSDTTGKIGVTFGQLKLDTGFVANDAYTASTTATSRISNSTWQGITNITVVDGITSSTGTAVSTNDPTTIRYLVSFDQGTTWKYSADGTTWSTSTLGNIATNGMTKAKLGSFTSTNWNAAVGGGSNWGGTGVTTLDFAILLKSSTTSVIPFVDQINVYFTAGAGADITPPDGGSITYFHGTQPSTTITITANRGTSNDMSTNANDYALEYSSATYTSNTCSAFSTWTNTNSAINTNSGDVTYSYTGTTGTCYKFRYRVKDTSGNERTYTSSSTVVIDSSSSGKSIFAMPGTMPTTTPTSGSPTIASFTLKANSNNTVTVTGLQFSPFGGGFATGYTVKNGTTPLTSSFTSGVLSVSGASLSVDSTTGVTINIEPTFATSTSPIGNLGITLTGITTSATGDRKEGLPVSGPTFSFGGTITDTTPPVVGTPTITPTPPVTALSNITITTSVSEPESGITSCKAYLSKNSTYETSDIFLGDLGPACTKEVPIGNPSAGTGYYIIVRAQNGAATNNIGSGVSSSFEITAASSTSGATLSCSDTTTGTKPTLGEAFLTEVKVSPDTTATSGSTTSTVSDLWFEIKNKAASARDFNCLEILAGGKIYALPGNNSALNSIAQNQYVIVHWNGTSPDQTAVTSNAIHLYANQQSWPGEVGLGLPGTFKTSGTYGVDVENAANLLDFMQIFYPTGGTKRETEVAAGQAAESGKYVWQDDYTTPGDLTARKQAKVDMTLMGPGKSFALIDDTARGGAPAKWGVLATPTAGATNGTPIAAGDMDVIGSWPWDGEQNAPSTMPSVGVEIDEALNTTTESVLAGTTGLPNSSSAKIKLCTVDGSGNPTTTCPAGNWFYKAEDWNGDSTNDHYKLELRLSSSSLTTGTTYAIVVTATQIAKQAGGFVAARTIKFKTSSTAVAGGTKAPIATPGFPQPNQTNVPPNIKAVGVNFDKPMDSSTLTTSTLTISPTVTGSTVSYDATSQTAFLNLGATLVSSTKYTVSVSTSVKDSNGVALTTALSWSFTTGSSADNTAPSVIGSTLNQYKNTAGSILNVPLVLPMIGVAFDRGLDPTTVTRTNIYIESNADSDNTCGDDAKFNDGTATTNLRVEYEAERRGIAITPNGPLTSNTKYLICATNSVRSAANVAITPVALQFTTATAAADATSPDVAFVEANNYGVTVFFSEPVTKSTAENRANYTIKASAAGTFGTAWNNATSVSLANAILTYRPEENSVKIDGLSGLTPGNDFLVEISTSVTDLTGNAFTSPTTLSDSLGGTGYDPKGNPYRGIIEDTTKQFTASTTTTGSSTAVSGNFSANTAVAFVPESNAFPFNALAGQTTIYGVNLPISTQVPADGYVYVKFPAGFDVTNAKKDTGSPRNNDINGPGTGTVGFSTSTTGPSGFVDGTTASDGVFVNTAINTVAIKLNTATNSGGYDFLGFDLAGIRNTSTPKEYGTDGYTLTVKTVNGSTLATLESLTTKPFFIKAGADNSLTVTIDLGGGNNGGADTMQVYLISPQTGPLEGTTDAFNAAGATNDATATFSNIPAGDYQLFTKPTLTLNSVDYAGKPQPTPVTVSSGANTKTLTLTKLAGAGVTTVTYTITGNAAIGDSEEIDLFASNPQKGFVVKTVTGSQFRAGGTNTQLVIPGTGQWFIGFGPAMPKGATNTAVTMPTNWMPPQPKELTVISTDLGGSKTIAFSLASQTMRTITGSVVDGSSKAIASAEVYAYSPTGGLGSRATSSTDGTFTLNIADNNTYIVGANAPGMPAPKEQSVKVAGGNVSNVSIKIAKGSRQITGTVLAGDGSTPNEAFVYAYRTDAPGNAGGKINTQGQFTLYVAAGSWKVGANIPGSPPMTEQTVTVASDSDPAALSFQATASTGLKTISGTITKDAAAVAGAFVSAWNTTSRNETQTASDGTYSIKVPSGTYTVEAFAPEVGPIGRLSGVNATNDIASQDFTITTKTFTVRFATSGLTLGEVLIDAWDNTNKRGGHIRLTNVADNSTTTVTVPAAGTYETRVNIPGIKLAGTDLSETSSNLTYTSSTNSLAIGAGTTSTDELLVTIPTTTRTVTGTVTAGGSNLGDAWVEATSSTTKAKQGARTNTSGAYTLPLADGAYYFEVKKPGYTAAPTQITIAAGNTTVNLTATASSTTITGTLQVAGVAASEGFVWAERYGGGYASTQVNTDGTFSLDVGTGAWKIFGVADGYKPKEATNCVAISTTGTTCSTTTTGITLNVTETVTLNPPVTESVTPASGGTVTDNSDGTTNFDMTLTIPANALGTDTSNGSISASETTNVPKTETSAPFGGKAKEIKATDSDGNPITTLNSAATLEFSYSKAELDANFTTNGTTSPTVSDVQNMTLSYWDETTLSWVTLPTTVTIAYSGGTEYANITSATLRGTTTHFSLFSAIVSSISSTVSSSAPSSSSSSSSSGGGGGGGSGVVSTVANTVAKAATAVAQAVANTFSSVSANVGKALTAVTGAVSGVKEKIATLGGTPVENVLSVENNGKPKNFAQMIKSALGTVGSFLASITIGDRLKTNGKDGVAVTVSQVADVRMDKNTDVEVGDITAKDGSAGVKMKHHGGQAWYKFKKVPSGEPLHEVTTASTVATIRGTSVNVEKQADGSEVFTLAEGSMSLTDSKTNKVTTLNAGESYIRKADGTVSVVKDGVTKLGSSWRSSNSTADQKFADFSDVKTSDWYYSFVTSLRQLGIVSGKTASSYAPNNTLTRAEILKIALAASGISATEKYTGGFSDISTSDWYAPYIATAVQHGIAKGYPDGSFRPNAPVNRAEAVKILIEAKKLKADITVSGFGDVQSGSWFAPYVAKAKAVGITSGYPDGTFRPDATVNRAEIAKMAIKLLDI